MRKKNVKPLEKKYNIAKYVIGTFSGNKKEWKRIMINGENTDYEMNKEGTLRDRNTKEIIEPFQISHPIDYYLYDIILPKGNKTMLSRHRMMAALFIPIPRKYREKGYQQENLVINHKDGVKGHDDLDNLEWCTQKENIEHALNHGLLKFKSGEDSHLATITDGEATEICELLAEGKRPKEVSEITGIREKVVRHIYHGEAWKQLTKNYEFPEYEGPKPYDYSDDVIKDVCDLIQEGKKNNREISEIAGVSERYISDIKTKKRRLDISSDYNFTDVPARNAPKAIVAKQVCELLQEGEKSVKEISEITGLDSCMVSGIKCGRYWKDISKDYTFPDTKIPARNDENIHKACLLFTKGMSDYAINKEIGISRNFLRKLRKREIRTDISSQYIF